MSAYYIPQPVLIHSCEVCWPHSTGEEIKAVEGSPVQMAGSPHSIPPLHKAWKILFQSLCLNHSGLGRVNIQKNTKDLESIWDSCPSHCTLEYFIEMRIMLEISHPFCLVSRVSWAFLSHTWVLHGSTGLSWEGELWTIRTCKKKVLKIGDCYCLSQA